MTIDLSDRTIGGWIVRTRSDSFRFDSIWRDAGSLVVERYRLKQILKTTGARKKLDQLTIFLMRLDYYIMNALGGAVSKDRSGTPFSIGYLNGDKRIHLYITQQESVMGVE